jgi:hypothetical protein
MDFLETAVSESSLCCLFYNIASMVIHGTREVADAAVRNDAITRLIDIHDGVEEVLSLAFKAENA